MNNVLHMQKFDWAGVMTRLSGSRLPSLIATLLLVYLGYLFAQLTWMVADSVVSVPAPPAVTSGSARPAPSQRRVPAPDVMARQIAARHIFGTAATTAAVPRAAVQAPVTQLKLILHGVFAAGKGDGFAIISEAGRRQQQLYRPGDKIAGAILKQVYPDRVVLQRNGRYETLRFPKEKNAGVMASTPVSTVSGNASANKRLSLVNQLQIIPVNRQGKLIGYRILPRQDRTLYSKLGIRPSDLVVAVNGVSVTDQKNLARMIEIFNKASQLEVEVVRQGARRKLQVTLP